MTDRGAFRRLAWSLAVVALALGVAATVFLVLGRHTPPPAGTFGFRGFGALFAVVFGTVGGLIASRQPTTPIGWLLLAAGFMSGVQEAAQQYAILSLQEGGLPAGATAAWFPTWIWVPGTAAVILAILLFPDGRLRSPRWRPLLWLLVSGTVFASVGLALAPGPLENFRPVINPFGIGGARGIMFLFVAAGMAAYLLGIVGSAVALALRFRSARGEERLQMKWIVLAAGLMAVSLASSFGWALPSLSGDNFPDLFENLVVLSFACVPVTMGIAILKYRLYDIDLVINKTVVYGILAAFITVVFLAIVVGVGTVVGGGSTFLAAVAAAVVAIVFQPARRWAQHLANRLVYGERATPYEVLSGFSERLAETYSVDDVLPRTARVLAEGVGAARVSILLRRAERLIPVAVWPEEETVVAEPRSFEVRHQGSLLGEIDVSMPPNEPLGPAQEQLVADVAAQAGLVLRNARLIDDLKESRQRLVAAQDEERRRIERNIHDGAQQQLVAMAVKLKLADSLLGKDEQRAHTMLGELAADTSQTLEDLRDLARGIYPPLLADKGLASAILSQSRKAAVPVRVETDGIGRYPQEFEAAVYFCVLEALQNVGKYAGEGAKATVGVREEAGGLLFEVADDGAGFDVTRAGIGAGFTNMNDRVGAIGGSLRVESAPGRGTKVGGAIPLNK
jgi:signal transduction histidine kinase